MNSDRGEGSRCENGSTEQKACEEPASISDAEKTSKAREERAPHSHRCTHAGSCDSGTLNAHLHSIVRPLMSPPVFAVLITAALLLASCGGMSAESFAERVREQGVDFELGEQLRSEQEGLTVYDFRIPPVDRTSSEARGTLEVYSSDEEAFAGWTRCLAAADLTCFRAGGVVVVLPEEGLEARRLAAAMRRLDQ